MDADNLKAAISELLNEINNFPTDQYKIIHLTRSKKGKESRDVLQDQIDQLRLAIKYMVFDLEATRRENKYLRKMLEHSEE